MAINAKEFREALNQIEINRGISKDVIVQSLKEAMIKGYRKELGGDDALVEVNIDPEEGIIEMFQIKNIVAEVQDDFLEVDEKEAKAVCKDGQSFIKDEKLYIPASIDELRKATAMSIKSILRQKFAEAEKDVLFEAFKDKINTMITGRVEKIDERGASINIGRTSVYLPRKQMIGDEHFQAGDQIRLFVSDVASDIKGAHIVVSRSNEGFLRCLFNEEIREIYDGTIVIKGIAREAGERSKVAVYSQNPDVDPAGACIGQNGSRIQKIVSQLGNGSTKEKIDIIAFSENSGLFIMESLKPAHVAGIIYDEEAKTATAIVKDDSLSLAIGRRGVNVRLAVRLTGYNIDIKTETDAISNGLVYQSFEQLQAEEVEHQKQLIAEMKAAQAQVVASSEDVLPGLPEGYVAPQARVYKDEEENNDLNEALELESEKEETNVVAPQMEEVKEEQPVAVQETVVAPTPVKEEVAPEVVEEVRTVKTTTTLSDLEKTLEASDKKAGSYKKNWRKNSKKDNEEEDSEKLSSTVDPSQRMSIYTEEELKAMEEEEKENRDSSEEDVDYDEYDEYYDDNGN
ncbi:MAG: transcription termination/antitermination protein NusA [Erysipelotrichaceae bacterium]|nr:transcription termination/antitermination protein NusA [Erysipelotrichaceae bacterium]